MKKVTGKFQFLVILFFLFSLCFPSVSPVFSQSSQSITATGQIWRPDASENYSVPFTLEFSPAGGDVRGLVNWKQEFTENDGSTTSLVTNWVFTGVFTGEDGGTVTGTVSGTADASGYPTFTYSGPWSGNLYANGYGEGVYDATIQAGGESTSGQFKWEVSFSPSAFSSEVNQNISVEFIAANYGINVANETGPGGKKTWTDHELGLLNDVLKELPKELLARLSMTSIGRAGVYINQRGQSKPSTFGVYHSKSNTVEIFDQANIAYDFQDDPNGDKQFKATILHELTHALQYKKDEYSNFDNPYKSPLLQSYMDATTPLAAVDTGIWENGWTYFEKRGDGGGWQSFGDDTNHSPTKYGTNDPLEDMSESVMMYVYDPQRLKENSPLRYNFIKEQIFGGAEYENGTRK